MVDVRRKWNVEKEDLLGLASLELRCQVRYGPDYIIPPVWTELFPANVLPHTPAELPRGLLQTAGKSQGCGEKRRSNSGPEKKGDGPWFRQPPLKGRISIGPNLPTW
jgi:hypothetical protein